MNKRLFLLIVPILLLASCQREMDWIGSPEIKATVEAEQKTRTSLSVNETGAGTIVWNPADQIDVFFGSTKVGYTSQNTSDAISALFKTTATLSDTDVSSTNIWGLYPSNSSSSCNGSSITTVLPSTQYGVPNTFDRDLFMGVAHSTSRSLQFYNVCGGIKFNLAYDDIKKVTFRGNNNENLAGTVSISFVNNVPQATVVNGVKEITLTPKTGSTFTKGADYYFVLLPGSLSSGFTMTFTATDGTTGTLNYTDKSVTIKRSVFARKGNMDVYAMFADERQPNNVIYYTSSDGKIIAPHDPQAFNASIVSNEYVNGMGVLTFDGDITDIGLQAFEACNSLTSISFPKSLITIGTFAFVDCRGLTFIEIPESVVSVGQLAFGRCFSLESIVVDPNNPIYDSRDDCNAIIETQTNTLVSGCKNTFIPTSVTGIGSSAFDNLYKLSSIVIPDSVTSIGWGAFFGCRGLSSIFIPHSVTNIGAGAFGCCRGLSSIVVDSDNPCYDSRDNCNAIIETSSNTLIFGCNHTIIPNTVKNIGKEAFDRYYDLNSINIPEGVISIGEYAFSDCTSLTSLEIPHSVTDIGHNAFDGCTGLESITVYATQVPSIQDDGGTFDNTNNCPIYVPAGSVAAYKSYWSAYASRIYSNVQAVDLGLSVPWASYNVGASSPEDYGDYFAWGETEPYYSSQNPLTWKTGKTGYYWDSYQWCNGSSSCLTKYNTDSSNGVVDNKTILDLSDDAARANWGGNWRTPTEAEWAELRRYCTLTWTTQRGVYGYRVTSKVAGYTDKSIFLPATGWLDVNLFLGVGSSGLYWSSSLYTSYPADAKRVRITSDGFTRGSYSRYYGLSVRPVYGDFIGVTSVALNKSSLTLEVGESETLIPTVMPENATEKQVSWTSSNTSVATVSPGGIVTAVSSGTATITAWASDGTHSAACTVTVTPYQAVDLGLSVQWASCNVGASSPEEYGDYFAWGETASKSSYSWSNYKWCNGSSTTLTKYNSNSSYGIVDNKTQLELEDDAAHVNWGGSWRMPTDAEISELKSNCNISLTTQGGVSGYLFTSKTNGNSIFVPNAGSISGSSGNNVGSRFFLWESKLFSSSRGHYFTITPNATPGVSYSYSGADRCEGMPIRPVKQ